VKESLLICRYCGEERSETAFEVANIIKGVSYRRKKCSFCKGRDRNLRVRRNSDWLRSYKKTLSCSVCGNSDYRVLEFHHPRGGKDYSVSDLVTSSIKRMQEEIAKCTVLCANCHKIEHWGDRTLRFAKV